MTATFTDAPWWQLLDGAVQSRGGYSQVARELGISRASVSTAHRGCYPAAIDRIADRIMKVFGQIDCPGAQTMITMAECATWQARPFDAGNHTTARMYRACRNCPRRAPPATP